MARRPKTERPPRDLASMEHVRDMLKEWRHLNPQYLVAYHQRFPGGRSFVIDANNNVVDDGLARRNVLDLHGGNHNPTFFTTLKNAAKTASSYSEWSYDLPTPGRIDHSIVLRFDPASLPVVDLSVDWKLAATTMKTFDDEEQFVERQFLYWQERLEQVRAKNHRAADREPLPADP